MLTFRSNGACETERALESLPSGYHAVVTRIGWMVVGPSGAFLVVDDDEEGDAPRVAAAAANELRLAMARHTGWVPFVEPLVASATPGVGDRAPLVPRDLLVPLIVEGNERLDESTVHHLVELAVSLDD